MRFSDVVVRHPGTDVPIQVLPETGSWERMHILDETCWCGPVAGETDGHPMLTHNRPVEGDQP